VVLEEAEMELRAIQLQRVALALQIRAVVEVAMEQGPQAAQAAPVSSSSKSTNNMTTKVYKFLGLDTAMHLLRPGAKCIN